jgi:hypothetical protein
VPNGWVTTAEIREEVYARHGVEMSVRSVRRILAQNCVGPHVPDAVDSLVNEAFGLLLDEAGRARPQLRIPSEVRLVGQRLQRVYPRTPALDLVEEIALSRQEREREERRAEIESSGLKWRRDIGIRNPWLAYVAALAGRSNIVWRAHRVAQFIAERRAEWLATGSDVNRIKKELRDKLAE